MKKIYNFFAFMFLVFSCMALVACGEKEEKTYSFPAEFNKLDGAVSDVGGYNQVGVVSMLKQDLKGNFARANVLAGIDSEGNAHEIEFTKDSQKEKTQLAITKFNQTEKYYIVEYSSKTTSNFDGVSCKFENYIGTYYSRIYLIEKQTNKVFALSVRDNPVAGKETFYIGESKYGTFGDDCGQYVIFRSGSYHYKVGVDAGELRVKQIFSLKEVSGGSFLFVDKNGNSIITKRVGENEFYYIMKDNVEIASDTRVEDPYKGADGRIYYGNKVLNDSGFFVITDDPVDEYVLRTEDLICVDGSDKYFYSKSWDYGQNKVIKFTDNVTSVSFEEIEIDLAGISTTERVGTHLFGIAGTNQIKIFNLLDGTSTTKTLEVDGILKIKAYENDKIFYEDSNSQKGLVDADGQTGEYVEPNYIELFVSPKL